MITHTVLFRLKPGADAHGFAAGLRAFAAAPPHALGPGAVTESLGLRPGPRMAHAMMVLQFPDVDAFKAYVEHALHLELLKDYLEPSCEGWWSVQA